MPLGINPIHDEFLQTHCFPVMQTGPWQGPGSWCYRVYCLKCDTEELADCRDDAWALLRAHKPNLKPTKGEPSFAVHLPRKAKKAAKLPRGGRKVQGRPVQDVEWEEFF